MMTFWLPVRRKSPCGLALAESERYLPSLIDELEESLASHGLAEDDSRRP
jgi:sulfite reductase beta subunit-like hemoprotein